MFGRCVLCVCVCGKSEVAQDAQTDFLVKMKRGGATLKVCAHGCGGADCKLLVPFPRFLLLSSRPLLVSQ